MARKRNAGRMPMAGDDGGARLVLVVDGIRGALDAKKAADKRLNDAKKSAGSEGYNVKAILMILKEESLTDAQREARQVTADMFADELELYRNALDDTPIEAAIESQKAREREAAAGKVVELGGAVH